LQKLVKKIEGIFGVNCEDDLVVHPCEVILMRRAL
jgi:hypothetical protein